MAKKKKSKKFKLKISKDPWMAATLFLVVLTGLSIAFDWNVTGMLAAPASSSSGTRTDFGTSDAAATVDLFVMSQCPFGVQAETGLLEALEAFGSDMQLNIRFIVSGSGDSLNSLHGQPELDENLRQLCIMSNYPGKYFDYLECFISDYQNAATQFEICADRFGIDKESVERCITGDAVMDMLEEDMTLTQEYGIRGSPTYYINGEKYSGGRDAQSIQSYICENIDSSLQGCSVELSGSSQQPTGSC